MFMVLAMVHGLEDSEPPNAPVVGARVEPPSVAEPPNAIAERLENESTESPEIAEGPESRRLGKHHHSSHESIAGGGVIVGGLVTATFATVFCYIRVTRKRNMEDNLGVQKF
ncbi:hypothetical protein IFM89_038286 [Coptis chinensis]|uniref:Uncharacterized protein n=1 Tax=Coptis chinensis TaxID=261450 RepID=A0A835H0E0_9MAGN|nr:hypothetical protein IFM89_038286 [Coptis chinensis]